MRLFLQLRLSSHEATKSVYYDTNATDKSALPLCFRRRYRRKYISPGSLVTNLTQMCELILCGWNHKPCLYTFEPNVRYVYKNMMLK